MKKIIQSSILSTGVHFKISLLLMFFVLAFFACDKQEDDTSLDGETSSPEKPGLVITGPGIFEVADDPSVLENFLLPDFSNLPETYQVKGTPSGSVTWQQEPAPGTTGFAEGLIVTLTVSDEGGNTAEKEVIISREMIFPASVDGIQSFDFIQEHEAEVPVNVYLLKYEADEEQASLALAITPDQTENFDPFLLDPAQITLHLYDEELRKINPLTYPDGIWELSSSMSSYITSCGAYLQFSNIKLNGVPAFGALTGGTVEQQRFSSDFGFANLTPQEAVLPLSCEPRVPATVNVPEEEPCKCTWRSRFTTTDKWRHDRDFANCWGGTQRASASLLLSGAKPFASGEAIDECTGNADVAVATSNTETLEVWVECTPRPCPECCVPKGNCGASPSFTAYASLDPPGTAVAGGRIKITGSGGCKGLKADAAGATRSSSKVDESVKFTIGLGDNSSIEVLPLHKSNGVMEGAFVDTDTKSGSECEFALHGIGVGDAKCLADADLSNWYARAEIKLHESVTNMLIKAWCTDGSSAHSNLGNAFEAKSE
ncbi:MAG: hypothetical protein AAFZ15_01495 [Bacteroidota bacterium]